MVLLVVFSFALFSILIAIQSQFCPSLLLAPSQSVDDVGVPLLLGDVHRSLAPPVLEVHVRLGAAQQQLHNLQVAVLGSNSIDKILA